jgi:hypothetical protein
MLAGTSTRFDRTVSGGGGMAGTGVDCVGVTGEGADVAGGRGTGAVDARAGAAAGPTGAGGVG